MLMYSTCIFCNQSLGTNEAIEIFPIGRRISFDAAMGRLWVICHQITGFRPRNTLRTPQMRLTLCALVMQVVIKRPIKAVTLFGNIRNHDRPWQ